MLFGDQFIETDELVIPHARLLDRAFVLRPLLDIDPNLIHPVTGERLDEALSKLGEVEIRQIAENWQK